MPRYFFHIENGERLSADDEGEDFPDIAAARNEAELIARDLSRNQLKPAHMRVVVTDEAGAQVAEVPMLRRIT